MRVSIVNCVSTAYQMMRFSDVSLLTNAGHCNFDYVVVRWLPSKEIRDYLDRILHDQIRQYSPIEGVYLHVVNYETNPEIGYVPNLRAMMNAGFERGFALNEYCGLVNTDCYFGPGWLRNLVRRANPATVINSVHITAATAPRPVEGIITEDLGPPIQGQFKSQRFVQLYDRHYRNELYVAPKDDYRQAATMPYLFHRQYWEKCGPWELTTENGTPDVRFFDRVHAAGASFALARDSIVYHHEAVERRGQRPPGTEGLPEE